MKPVMIPGPWWVERTLYFTVRILSAVAVISLCRWLGMNYLLSGLAGFGGTAAGVFLFNRLTY